MPRCRAVPQVSLRWILTIVSGAAATAIKIPGIARRWQLLRTKARVGGQSPARPLDSDPGTTRSALHQRRSHNGTCRRPMLIYIMRTSSSFPRSKDLFCTSAGIELHVYGCLHRAAQQSDHLTVVFQFRSQPRARRLLGEMAAGKPRRNPHRGWQCRGRRCG